MSELEVRLRRELRAESEEITPGDLALLRLPERDGRHGAERGRGPRWGGPGRGGRGSDGRVGWDGSRWAAWAKPLAAAAAVTAVVAGTLIVARSLPGRPAAPGAPRAGVPAYYAYAVQGDIYNYVSGPTQYSESVNGRHAVIRSTATGRLLAMLSPPAPDNDFSLIAGDASGRTFVLAARRYWERNANASPKVLARNPRTPLRFLLVRVAAGGHVAISDLSLPVTVTPGQQPSIALSPDGARLALAYGGAGQAATVQVITLATRQVRRWVTPRAGWTPAIAPQGSWSANGRTLAVRQLDIPRAQAKTRYAPPVSLTVRLLDTAGPGPAISSRLVVLSAPAGESGPGSAFLTPDGATLIGDVETRSGPPVRGDGWRGELAVYSAGTGALLRTEAPWAWRWASAPGHGGFPDPLVAWSDATGSRLILLHPSHGLNVLGVLEGGAFATGSALLPQRAAGYQALQNALRAPRMAW